MTWSTPSLSASSGLSTSSRITDVKIDVSGETPGIGADIGEKMAKALLDAQGAEIDGVSGATMSSNAIKEAAKTCIAQAKGEAVIVDMGGPGGPGGGPGGPGGGPGGPGGMGGGSIVDENWRVAPEAITEFAAEYTADVVIVGGGQPICNDQDLSAERGARLYDLDAANPVRFSHENTQVQKLYEEYLEAPLGHKSHHLLHTDQRKWSL